MGSDNYINSPKSAALLPVEAVGVTLLKTSHTSNTIRNTLAVDRIRHRVWILLSRPLLEVTRDKARAGLLEFFQGLGLRRRLGLL
jgi:hypothetical protein